MESTASRAAAQQSLDDNIEAQYKRGILIPVKTICKKNSSITDFSIDIKEIAF